MLENRKNSINKLGMFDMVKGILMLLIIAGHSITDYFHFWEYTDKSSPLFFLINAVSSISMYGLIPMFFMICGYGLRKKSMSKAIKGQFKYFWKPYLLVVVATLVLVIIKKVLISGDILEGVRYQVLPYLLAFCPGERSFLGLYMVSIGPIWFFWVFVTAGILANFILQENRLWGQFILIIIFSCLGLMLRNITLPWCIQQTCICTGYMYIGWLMKKHKILGDRLPVYLILLVVLLCVSSVISGGYIEVSQNVYATGAQDLLVSYVAGIILVFGAIKINYFEGKISDVLCWIGKNAMYICCIHTVAYTVIPWERMAEYLDKSKIIGIVIEMILQYVIAIGGCKCIEWFQQWKRTKYFRLSNKGVNKL